MNPLVLDFETYFDNDYSLSKMTYAEYIMDPRFHELGVAIRHPDGASEFRPDVGVALEELQARYGQELERAVVVVHNGHFDLAVLSWRHRLTPRFVVDTLQLAHAVIGRRDQGGGSASLKTLAAHFGLEPKGSIDEFKGVRNPSALQLAGLARYANHDAALTAAIAERLLRRLSRPEVELRIALHALNLHNQRGFRVDLAAIDPLIDEIKADTATWFARAGVTPTQVRSGQQFGRLLQDALQRTGRSLPMKMGAHGQIPAIAKKDPAMQALAEDGDPVVQALVRTRLSAGTEAQLVSRLERLKRAASARGGVLPVHLVYYGASTGRFSGGGKLNVQNLPKHGVGKRIRGLLMPPEGQRLIIADLAQIECRIVAVLAGEHVLVEAFRQRRDIYSEEASGIFGETVAKPAEGDHSAEAARMVGLRETGKQEVLGLGFGLGALKFYETLLATPATASLFRSGELSQARCAAIVRSFRERFPGIPQLWANFEDAARHWCSGEPVGTVVGAAMHSDPDDPGMRLVLPSTRWLRYPRLRLVTPTKPIVFLNDQGQREERLPTKPALVYGSDEKPIHLYGGKLLENVVQAIARDILVEAILRIEKRGVAILSHVHDEIIATAPVEGAAGAAALVEEEMTRPVPWLDGLPLAVDIKITDRYTK